MTILFLKAMMLPILFFGIPKGNLKEE